MTKPTGRSTNNETVVRSVVEMSPELTTRTVRDSFVEMEAWLNDKLVKMEEEVRYTLTSILIARMIFLLGSPGCGKSHLAKSVAKCFGNRDEEWFYVSIQANTTSDEVFGGAIAEELLKGNTVYNLEMGAANFRIVIVDEAFKLENPDLYHKLIAFFDEESTVKSGGRSHKTKLEFAILTSNELPDLVAHEALLNRINIKRYVKDLEGEDCKRAIQAHGKRKRLLSTPPRMTWEKVYAAREECCQVEVPDSILNILVFDAEYERLKAEALASGASVPEIENCKSLKVRLQAKGIRISQRVLNQLASESEEGNPSFLQAIAWLHGDKIVDESHLMWLTDCLWVTPDQRTIIQEVIKSLDDSQDARERLEGINEILTMIGAADIVNGERADLVRWHTRINNEVLKPIDDLLDALASNKSMSPRCQKIVDEIKTIKKDLIAQVAVVKKRATAKVATTTGT